MNVLKNRMQNGTPFLKSMAMERINALADNLEITQAEARELTKIAQAKGLEVLPADAMTRLSHVEEAVNSIIEGREPVQNVKS